MKCDRCQNLHYPCWIYQDDRGPGANCSRCRFAGQKCEVSKAKPRQEASAAEASQEASAAEVGAEPETPISARKSNRIKEKGTTTSASKGSKRKAALAVAFDS